MAKNKDARSLLAWVVGAAFAVFSGMVALGLLHRADLWALRILEEHTSGFLDKVAEIFSLFGTAGRYKGRCCSCCSLYCICVAAGRSRVWG